MKTRILPLAHAREYRKWHTGMTLVGNGKRFPFSRDGDYGLLPVDPSCDICIFKENVIAMLEFGFAHIEEEIPQPSLKELLGPGWVSIDPLTDKPHWQRSARLTRRTDLFIIVFDPSCGYWGNCTDVSQDINEIVAEADTWAKSRGGWAE